MEFYYSFSVILAVRLFFYFNNKVLTRKQFIEKLVFTIFPLLVFKLSIFLLAFIITSIAIYYLFYKIEKSSSSITNDKHRISELIILLIAGSFFYSDQAAVTFNQSILNFLYGVKNWFFLFKFFYSVDWFHLWVFIFGFLLVTNELNILIRIIFLKLDLVPSINSSSIDNTINEKEYNAGRIIGILERIIIFCLILIDQYEAMGLIIAAKSFARFKAMDERNFAEYVLIGTLLSVSLSVAVSIWIKFLITG